jgi:putative two-component system response regulator
MPVMNGYEVIKQLRGSAKTVDIPVIFLSAHIDPGHELEGLGLGAVDYVFKPFSPLLLMRRIETHTLLSSQKEELKRYNENSQTTALKNNGKAAELQNSIKSAIAELAEFRNDNLDEHIVRTQQYLQLLSDSFAEIVKAAN